MERTHKKVNDMIQHEKRIFFLFKFESINMSHHLISLSFFSLWSVLQHILFERGTYLNYFNLNAIIWREKKGTFILAGIRIRVFSCFPYYLINFLFCLQIWRPTFNSFYFLLILYFYMNINLKKKSFFILKYIFTLYYFKLYYVTLMMDE